jgi:hypothetical protein
MVMSMAVRLAAARGRRFSIPDRSGHLFRPHDGHLFPSEMDTLGDRLELVRDAALARRGRAQHGPADDRLGEAAGG